MSHFTCTVALPGHIEPGGLRIALDYALSPFNENMEVEPYECDCDDPDHTMTTYNPDSQWDWWVVGGRWGGFWTLKGSALITDFVKNETEPSAFGLTDESAEYNRVDCARVRAIEPETLTPAFSFIDLDGKWNESGRMCWFGVSKDDKDEAEWAAQYLTWIQTLPEDTWLFNCDLHI